MIRQDDPHKRGRASKRKGANAERELANIIRENWGYPVQRGKVFYHESDLVGLKGIHIECKRVERLNVSQAYKQAVLEAEIRNDGMPAVFHRKDGEGWMVTMSLEDWMELYGEWV